MNPGWVWPELICHYFHVDWRQRVASTKVLKWRSETLLEYSNVAFLVEIVSQGLGPKIKFYIYIGSFTRLLSSFSFLWSTCRYLTFSLSHEFPFELFETVFVIHWLLFLFEQCFCTSSESLISHVNSLCESFYTYNLYAN